MECMPLQNEPKSWIALCSHSLWTRNWSIDDPSSTQQPIVKWDIHTSQKWNANQSSEDSSTPRSQLSSLVAVLSFKTKITNGNFEGGKFKCLIRIGLVMNITQVPKKFELCFKICLPLNSYYHDPRPWSNQWLLVFLREGDDIALPQSGQIQGRQQLTSPPLAKPRHFLCHPWTYAALDFGFQRLQAKFPVPPGLTGR